MPPAPDPFVALFVRFPTPGDAKTRLVPALGPTGAARLHRRLVERTLATVRAAGLRVQLWTTGADFAAFREWLGDDVPLVEQREGDLGDRMARAAAQAPVILLGADLPDLTAGHLTAAAAALRSTPAVIGPAEDGGYYLLGLARSAPFLFCDMPWGTADVLPRTLHRLDERGWPYRLLEPLADLDRPDDLARWPWLGGC